VRHPGRGDRSHELETAQVVTHPIEQPLAAAQERRHDVELHLVDEAGRQILLRGSRSAGEGHILAAGGAPRQLQRGLDPGGDEREGRPSLELEWRPRVVREHETG